MNRTPHRRWHAVVLTALLAVGIATSATACNPPAWTWRAGKTHGVIVEAAAGRGSLGIYRAPRKALHDVYKSSGIRMVQDFIWKYGQPPMISKTFVYRGRAITTSFGTSSLRGATRSLIYDHTEDLRGALLDSQARRNCLALTLVSYGAPTINWTHKSVGCQMGELPR